MTTTRALAVAAYAAAVASPAGADWRSVADQLHAVIVPVRSADAAAGAPRWFADWKLGKVYSLDSLAVQFADGVTVRCNLAKAPGKLPRIAAACRVAVAFYRAQTGRDAVPAFASLECLSDGATFDAEACSRLTADLRRTAHVPAAVRPAVTAEAVARMRAEVERREAGLAVALADHAELIEAQRACRNANGLSQREARAAAESRIAMWRTAAEAGAGELARMLGAAPPSGPVFRPRVRPLHLETPDPAADWCEAVADLYGQPGAWAVGETWEPGAELAPVPTTLIPAVTILAAEISVPTPVEGMAMCPAVRQPCRVGCPFRSGCGHPVEEIGSAVDSATGSECEPDLSTDAEPTYPLASDDDDGGWQPDTAAHTVIALCHSDKARAALFERIQDGTFPAADRTAKAGAWRITLADALDCQGIGSLRFVGLPRKPYTRRAVPTPVMAIRTPLVAIRGAVPVPVTLHAAPQL